MAVHERVAAQLEALLTASGWELGGVTSDEEAEAVAARATNAFVKELLLSQPTRAYGLYFQAEWAGKTAEWAAAFRSGASLTTNNMLEGWHSQLKGVFLRKTKRTVGWYAPKSNAEVAILARAAVGVYITPSHF